MNQNVNENRYYLMETIPKESRNIDFDFIVQKLPFTVDDNPRIFQTGIN